MIYSESYNVPVLYLNAFQANGKQLNPSEFKQIFMDYEQIKKDTSQERQMLVNLLSQQEHPILFKPFYFIHPCKTSEWMKLTELTKQVDGANYTLKWLSFIFFALNIEFDVRFGKKI